MSSQEQFRTLKNTRQVNKNITSTHAAWRAPLTSAHVALGVPLPGCAMGQSAVDYHARALSHHAGRAPPLLLSLLLLAHVRLDRARARSLNWK